MVEYIVQLTLLQLASLFTRAVTFDSQNHIWSDQRFGNIDALTYKIWCIDIYNLGVFQNSQHYQERTLSTFFVTPSLPTKRVLWKCWFGDPFSKSQYTINDITDKCTAALDPLAPNVHLWKWWQFWTIFYLVRRRWHAVHGAVWRWWRVTGEVCTDAMSHRHHVVRTHYHRLDEFAQSLEASHRTWGVATCMDRGSGV